MCFRPPRQNGENRWIPAQDDRTFIVRALRHVLPLHGRQMFPFADDEDVALLMERHDLEQVKFQIDLKKMQSQSYHKGLFDTPLYSVGQYEQARFYTREEIDSDLAGAGMKIDGPAWYVKSYKNSVVELQAGGKVIGRVPSGLPGFRMPSFEWSAVMHLIGATITISLIGFMEAISIAKAMAAKTRQSLSPDRELMGQGLSNIVGSMFQAYPVSGSFSRSAVNINAGAVTGFSSVITVIIVAFALLFLTPLLYYLPQATLAAVIIKAVAGLISLKPMIHAWRASRHDGIVALVTFVFTLALAPELELGILLGMLLSLILLLFRIMKPRVAFPPLRERLLPAEAVADGIMTGLQNCHFNNIHIIIVGTMLTTEFYYRFTSKLQLVEAINIYS